MDAFFKKQVSESSAAKAMQEAIETASVIIIPLSRLKHFQFCLLIMHLANEDIGNIMLFNKSVNGHDESWKQLVSYMPQLGRGYDLFTGKEK